MKKLFSFPIDPKTHRALKRLAEAQDRSKAAVIRTLLNEKARELLADQPEQEREAAHAAR